MFYTPQFLYFLGFLYYAFLCVITLWVTVELRANSKTRVAVTFGVPIVGMILGYLEQESKWARESDLLFFLVTLLPTFVVFVWASLQKPEPKNDA